MIKICILMLCVPVLYTGQDIGRRIYSQRSDNEQPENAWCLYGGTYNEKYNSCYILMKYDTFSGAQSTCQQIFNGGELPCIFNPQNTPDIPETLQCSIGSLYWLGIYPNGSCAYNSTFDRPVSPTANTQTMCTAIDSLGDSQPYSCSAPLPFYCGYPPVTQYCKLGYTYFEHTRKCYKLVAPDAIMDFYEAGSYCEINEKALSVSIHDKTENDFVLQGNVQTCYADFMNSFWLLKLAPNIRLLLPKGIHEVRITCLNVPLLVLAQSQPNMMQRMWIGLKFSPETLTWVDGTSNITYYNGDNQTSFYGAPWCGAMWIDPKDFRLGTWNGMNCSSSLTSVMCQKNLSIYDLPENTTPLAVSVEIEGDDDDDDIEINRFIE